MAKTDIPLPGLAQYVLDREKAIARAQDESERASQRRRQDFENRRRDQDYLTGSRAVDVLKKAGSLLRRIHRDVRLTVTNTDQNRRSPVQLQLQWNFVHSSNRPRGFISWNEVNVAVARGEDDQITGFIINAGGHAERVTVGIDDETFPARIDSVVLMPSMSAVYYPQGLTADGRGYGQISIPIPSRRIPTKI